MYGFFALLACLSLFGGLVALVRPEAVKARSRRGGLAGSIFLFSIFAGIGAALEPANSWWSLLGLLGLAGVINSFLTPGPHPVPKRLAMGGLAMVVMVIGAAMDEGSPQARAQRSAIAREVAAKRDSSAKADAEAERLEIAARKEDSAAVRTLAASSANKAQLLAADARLHLRPVMLPHNHARAVTAMLDSTAKLSRSSDPDDIAAAERLLAYAGPWVAQQGERQQLLLNRVERQKEAIAARREAKERAEIAARRERLRTDLPSRVAYKCGVSVEEAWQIAERGSEVFEEQKGMRVSSQRMLRLLDSAVPIEAAPQDCRDAAALIITMTGE